MEVRPCTQPDLERLRRQWPTFDDVAGSHYGEQAGGATTFLVCWHDDEPLGWALIQWRGCVGENARAAFPHCVELNHLQVRPALRGRGAGTAILAAAEQRVRDSGCDQIAVSVGADNTGAGRLYQRLDYRPTGIVDDCSYSWFDDHGSRHDEVESSELLVKHL